MTDLGYSYDGLSDQEKRACRVCGLIEPHLPYGENGFLWDWDICDCCGVTHGYQDIDVPSTKLYRERWLAAGAPWRNSKSTPKPEGWDVHEQLRNVPGPFR
ncbi:hypothetical protein [Deinococcus pimensis]|uniref:hypothetical protein n=1 Tax=Deinococcus pimensis TaxID=309888 RepID=UPI0004BB556E|nr:hypothetical protein [Deinococcus pimensis]